MPSDMTGTLHNGVPPYVLFPNGDRAPVIGEMPPNVVRVPAENGMADQFEAYPLVDWPPTVVYRFVGQVPQS